MQIEAGGPDSEAIKSSERRSIGIDAANAGAKRFLSTDEQWDAAPDLTGGEQTIQAAKMVVVAMAQYGSVDGDRIDA